MSSSKNVRYSLSGDPIPMVCTGILISATRFHDVIGCHECKLISKSSSHIFASCRPCQRKRSKEERDSNRDKRQMRDGNIYTRDRQAESDEGKMGVETHRDSEGGIETEPTTKRHHNQDRVRTWTKADSQTSRRRVTEAGGKGGGKQREGATIK